MMFTKNIFYWMIPFFFLIIPAEIIGSAGEGNYTPHLDGSDLPISWVIPFIGILFSIAVFPLIAPNFWHHHFGKVCFLWSLIFIIPFLYFLGLDITLYSILHVGFLEYIPFILLLLALFTISGGIFLTGKLIGNPKVNVGIILIGTILAGWIGTTGAPNSSSFACKCLAET